MQYDCRIGKMFPKVCGIGFNLCGRACLAQAAIVEEQGHGSVPQAFAVSSVLVVSPLLGLGIKEFLSSV
jgi:hypothetical protein